MKKIFFVLASFFILACKDSKPLTLTNVLASECFWDITGDRQVIGGLNSCYRFFPDGQCFFYYYNFYNKKRTDSVFRYDDGDVIVPDSWSVIGDTLLVARGAQYKVLAFAKDSVLIEGFKRDTMLLHKNCKTFVNK